MMTESSNQENTKAPPSKVVLKDYSKIVFFYPIFLFTIIAWLIQALVYDPNQERPQAWLSIIWIMILFINLIVVGFDFPSIKSLSIFSVIDLVVLIILLAYNGGLDEADKINLYLSSSFYAGITLTFGIVLLIAAILGQLSYVEINKEGIVLKKLGGESHKFPIENGQSRKGIWRSFRVSGIGCWFYPYFLWKRSNHVSSNCAIGKSQIGAT